MSTTDVIAVIALVVSIGAGAAAIVSLVLQFGERRRREEEIGLLRTEGKRRDEELELLRQQLALLRRQVDAEQRAELRVFGGVPAERRGGGIEYNVGVQNVGGAAASEVAVELVECGGVLVGTPTSIVKLVPGEKGHATVVTPSVYAGPSTSNGTTAGQIGNGWPAGQQVGAPAG